MPSLWFFFAFYSFWKESTHGRKESEGSRELKFAGSATIRCARPDSFLDRRYRLQALLQHLVVASTILGRGSTSLFYANMSDYGFRTLTSVIVPTSESGRGGNHVLLASSQFFDALLIPPDLNRQLPLVVCLFGSRASDLEGT